MATAKADDASSEEQTPTTRPRPKSDTNTLADWMGNLPSRCLDVPLHTLFIPGSHNSGTYELRKDWEVGPDADQAVRSLSALPMAKDILLSWSQCQKLTILGQLEAGVRFLDFRVAHHPTSDELYAIHSLYGPKVSTCMEDVKSFLEKHDKEVVLIDFNHFYAMELEHHIQLITYLMFIFDGMLCPYSSIRSLTLNSLREKGTRVIVFYGDSSVAEFPDLWPKHNIKSIWSNTMDVEKCLTHQEQAAKSRSEDIFHVCQAVLTPGTSDLMQKFYSNLQTECASRISARLPAWLVCDSMKQCAGMVYTVDFVEDGGFVQSVVELNK